MTDRDLLELIASQVSNLTTNVDTLTTRVDGLTTRVDTLAKDMIEVKADLQFTKNAVIRIENDHGQKLRTLLNGFKQNAERLDRVEEIPEKHERKIAKGL